MNKKYLTTQPHNSEFPIVTVGSLMQQIAAETGYLVVPEELMCFNESKQLKVGMVVLIDDGSKACIRTIDTISVFPSAKDLYASDFLSNHVYREFIPGEKAIDIAKHEEKRYGCTGKYCLLTIKFPHD
jgi:hypothetical protein